MPRPNFTPEGPFQGEGLGALGFRQAAARPVLTLQALCTHFHLGTVLISSKIAFYTGSARLNVRFGLQGSFTSPLGRPWQRPKSQPDPGTSLRIRSLFSNVSRSPSSALRQPPTLRSQANRFACAKGALPCPSHRCLPPPHCRHTLTALRPALPLACVRRFLRHTHRHANIHGQARYPSVCRTTRQLCVSVFCHLPSFTAAGRPPRQFTFAPKQRTVRSQRSVIIAASKIRHSDSSSSLTDAIDLLSRSKASSLDR